MIHPNVTSRKRLRRRRQRHLCAKRVHSDEQTQLLSAIVNASGDAILSKTLDGIITSWNPAAERMFGYSAQEIIGKPKTLLFPPERLHEEELILKNLKLGIKTEHFETIRLHKDGTHLHVSVTISPIKNPDGHITGASTIARDITKQKNYEIDIQNNIKKFQTLIEAIPDTIYRVNRDFICIDILGNHNKNVAVPVERIIGKRLCDFVPPEVGEQVRAAVIAAFDTKTAQSCQYQISIDGGATLYRDARIVAQSDDIAMIVVRDISDSKVLEQELRQSEAQFNAFLNHGAAIAWVTNVSGHIEYFNEPYGKRLGKTLQECRGKSLTEFFPESVAEIFLGHISQIMQSGQTLETEESIVLPDGTQQHWLIHTFPLPNRQGQVFIGSSALDITQKKEAQVALNRNEQRLREAQHIAHIGSWERNLITNQVLWSEEMFHIYRFSPDEGMPTFERVMSRVHPDDWDRYQAILAAANSSEERYECDLRLLFDDGTVTWGHAVTNVECDATGKVVRRFGTFMDVTAQKQAELALKQSQQRLELAQQVAKVGSWEFDLHTKQISWSSELFRLLNIDPQQGELDYQAQLALYHPEDGAQLDAAVARAVTEKKEYSLDLRYPTDDGLEWSWFHAVGKPECDEAGQVVRLVGTLTDITERKRIEEAVRKSQISLNLAQAMAHVGSWERDLRTGEMVWSEEMFRLCGLQPGSITPSIEALTTFTHPLDRRRALECMEEAIRTGIGASLDIRILGADAVLRYISIRTEILKDEMGQAVGSRGTMTDVTERVKALQEQTKFVSLIENSNDFIALSSLDGTLMTINPAGRQLVGLERIEEVVTTMLPDFMTPQSWEEMRQDILPMVMRDERWDGECQLVHVGSGRVHDMQASFFLIRNPVSGEPMCLATVQRDITTQKWLNTQLQENLSLIQVKNSELACQKQELENINVHLEEANKLLDSLAMTDGLTGAKNNRAFQDKLQDEFQRSKRTGNLLSIILLDVDHFKAYNDQFGHPEGDNVLKKLVQILQSQVREIDLVARYGGEEFVLLLPETDQEGALELATRIKIAIESENWPFRKITASFGIASSNISTPSAEELIKIADTLLYNSKSSGRNCISIS